MKKVKATFVLTDRGKRHLERLKARLRAEGIARSVATESAILEVLIQRADFRLLLRAFS